MDAMDGPANEKPANMTRGNVTGKVPKLAKRGLRGRKLGKLSPDRKKHVGHLQQRGVISASAAAKSGLK